MSTAYVSGDTLTKPKLSRDQLGLPVDFLNKTKLSFTLDLPSTEDDVRQLFEIFENVIKEGQSYPQETTSFEEFKQYFLSYYAFVVRTKNEVARKSDDQVVAGFYIKPNFPGRSSHLANYGLVVHNDFCGLGIGNFMVNNCIKLARMIGFKALYTNLVYENNLASIQACLKHGFVQVGRVPKAGNLKDYGYADALQFYRDLSVDS